MHLSHFADYSFMATLNKEQNFTDLKVTQKLKKRFLTLQGKTTPCLQNIFGESQDTFTSVWGLSEIRLYERLT